MKAEALISASETIILLAIHEQQNTNKSLVVISLVSFHRLGQTQLVRGSALGE
jgi:hypothetical protein